MKLKDLLLYKKQLVTEMSKLSKFVQLNNSANEDRPIELQKILESKDKWAKYIAMSAELIKVKNLIAEVNASVGIIHKLNQIAEFKGCINIMQCMEGDPGVRERSMGYNQPNKEVQVLVAFDSTYRDKYIAETEKFIAELHREIEVLNFTTEVTFEPAYK